jgi:(E)-4-hydroxy-3-methylbut-2-enyl-diphosphate synthase
MIKRRKTKTVQVGALTMGSRAPITIQSMTKVPTTAVGRCVAQIEKLVAAGCDLVRIAVPRAADTAAFARIVQQVNIPLVADIHFSPARAIEAIEAGAAKIRLNPGNIKERKDIYRIIDAARSHGTAMRIGVNEASIRNLKADVSPGRRVGLMVKEMSRYIRLFEKRGFEQLVLSAKSSDTLRTIQVNRRLAETFDYPLHLGLTHAGLPQDAQIPSAVTLGTLLAEGIGDTVRVSAAGDPVTEVKIAQQILTALGLHERSGPELIVCPTCGRCEIDVVRLAKRLRRALQTVGTPLRIAAMGCVVNGPGEAADADLAICAGKGKAFLYRHGERIAVVPEDQIETTLLKHIERLESQMHEDSNHGM